MVISIGSRILLRGLASLSIGLRRFQWRWLAIRIGRRIPGLARLFIIFSFRASIRSIWIREGSLEDALGHAGSGCGVKAKHKAYNLYTVRSRRAGELLLCRAVWRIRPLIIVNGESKATRTGLHGPPPYLEKRKCVSTSLMRSDASCMHQDTRHLH